MYDVIIIGGSYAGMSAAMQVARARRRVAVIDAGMRRNRFATASHGFLGRDGHAPGLIAEEAKAQLMAYPTVDWIVGTAIQASGTIDDFRITTDTGRVVSGRRVVLATGVEDVLPDVPGLAGQWGVGAMTCPYCHGYELDMGPVGVLATSQNSIHQAMLLPEWGTTTFFTDNAVTLDTDTSADLARRGVTIEETPVAAIDGDPGSPLVRLEDGRRIEIAGLFVATSVRMASPVAEMLGCTFGDSPFGSIIAVDAMKATSVPGVIACGDVTRGAGSVALSVGDGALAGTMVHRSLVFPETVETNKAA
ncbi:NAD(P)/FAD-dependent oxidoreductase [Mesorhizobium sp. CAU 1732]|uniref:NAD(P)/FAD-dependent oxidoreductase n=1 Tax=Mesorhizobium sp. CAU 1732 TaxID=3140358 RepID=UPI003260B177